VLKLLMAACFVLCAACAPRRAGGEPVATPTVDRPGWLDLVPRSLEAVHACVRARAPELAYAVHVQELNDMRIGVVTLGVGGTLERCVHRFDFVEYRARARDLQPADFAGQPAVWPGSERPDWAVDTYAEEIVAAGVTVAWVHWLGGRR
jgi:hypothetical protein